MAPQTFPTLYLGPTGNQQGTVKTFHLETGKVHNVCTKTTMPMPTLVIRKVEVWGKKAKHDALENSIEFLNQNEKKFDCDTNEEPDEGI